MSTTIIGIAAAAAWLYLIALRGGFWRVRDDAGGASSAPPRAVVAVVPARDEADVIGRAIGSLLAQDYRGAVHIIVVDDHSGDGTAAVARDAAAQAGASDRLTVIASAPMPAGWTGKLWAMRQGAAAARAHGPDYLLLTDADIVHAPGNLAVLVARAEADGYDLVSLMVRLHCASGWERLLIPAFVWFFFMLYPPRWVADPNSRTAAAAVVGLACGDGVGRRGVAGDEPRLCADIALLPLPGSAGALIAVDRAVLHRGHDRFGGAVLARPRRPLEGPLSGRRAVIHSGLPSQSRLVSSSSFCSRANNRAAPLSPKAPRVSRLNLSGNSPGSNNPLSTCLSKRRPSESVMLTVLPIAPCPLSTSGTMRTRRVSARICGSMSALSS